MVVEIEGTSGHQNPLRGFQTPNPLPPFGKF
jgi:hypothetical protein